MRTLTIVRFCGIFALLLWKSAAFTQTPIVLSQGQVFDFAVGDTFQYLANHSRATMNQQLQMVIVGKTTVNGSTTYRRKWEQYTFQQTGPSTFGTVYHQWTDSLRIEKPSDTLSFRIECPAIPNPTAQYFCQDSNYLYYNGRRTLARRYNYDFAQEGEERYAIGLGLTYQLLSGEDPGLYDYFELVYFQKEGQRWGQKLRLPNAQSLSGACAGPISGAPAEAVLCADLSFLGNVILTTRQGRRLHSWGLDPKGNSLGNGDLGLMDRPWAVYRDSVVELAPDSTVRRALALPPVFTQTYAAKAVCPRPGGYFFLATKQQVPSDTVWCVMTDVAFTVRSVLPVPGRFAGMLAPTSDGGCLAVNPVNQPTWPQGTHGPSIVSKITADNTLQYQFVLTGYADIATGLMPLRCAGQDRFLIPHILQVGHAGTSSYQQFATEVELRENPLFLRDYHTGYAYSSPLPVDVFTNLGRQLPDGNRIELRRLYHEASPQYNIAEVDLFSLRELAPDGTLLWQEDVERALLQDVALYDLFQVSPGNVVLIGIKNNQLWYYRQHCTPPAPANCPNNLLQNPGFEAGNISGWPIQSNHPSGSAVAAPYAYSGDYALLLREGTVGQRVPVKPGGTYLLRAVAKAEKTDESAFINVNILSNTGPIGSKTTYITSAGFKPYFIEVTLPNNAAFMDVHATTVGSGNIMVDEFCLSEQQSVGASTVPDEVPFRLYPNPASESLTVDGSASNTSLQSITLYNMLGKSILSKTFTSNNATVAETLDISNLPSGYYVVRLMLKNGMVYGYKVMVHHLKK